MADEPEPKYKATARIRAALHAGTLTREQAIAALVEAHAGGLTELGAADTLDRPEPDPTDFGEFEHDFQED